jgi:methylene-tetrahydromethanopterin dehydrogenase
MAEERKKNLLYLLDSDEFASPFDINVAYDAGFDVVIPYNNVKPDKIRRLIEDMMFSRGFEGSKHTKIFINGNDLDVVRENMKVARKTMVDPFQLSMFVDPRGGYTTGASIVAQIEAYLDAIKKKSLSECNVIIFGGTGAVGHVIATLCAKFGAKTMILSRSIDKATKIVDSLKSEYGVTVIPKQFGPENEMIGLVSDKDVIFCCGPPGVQMISLNFLKKLPKNKILADLNAVPPLGIEGINVNKKNKEIEKVPGFYYHGALSVGDVKLQTEKIGLKAIIDADGKKTFDFMDFYTIAKDIIEKKKNEKKEEKK